MIMLLALITCTIFSKPNTFYVSPAGNDANDGLSRSTPKLSATDLASSSEVHSGDTIWLIGGTNYSLTGGQTGRGEITSPPGVNWGRDADSSLLLSNHDTPPDIGTCYFRLADNAYYDLKIRFVDKTCRNVVPIGLYSFGQSDVTNCTVKLDLNSDSGGPHVEGGHHNIRITFTNCIIFANDNCFELLNPQNSIFTVWNSTFTQTNFLNNPVYNGKPYRVFDFRLLDDGFNFPDGLHAIINNSQFLYSDTRFTNQQMSVDTFGDDFVTTNIPSCLVFVEHTEPFTCTNLFITFSNCTVTTSYVTNYGTFNFISALTNQVYAPSLTRTDGKMINETNTLGGTVMRAGSVATTNGWQD